VGFRWRVGVGRRVRRQRSRSGVVDRCMYERASETAVNHDRCVMRAVSCLYRLSLPVWFVELIFVHRFLSQRSTVDVRIFLVTCQRPPLQPHVPIIFKHLRRICIATLS
jgi:hypothetical protein